MPSRAGHARFGCAGRGERARRAAPLEEGPPTVASKSRFCPVCGREFGEEVQFCTQDRTPLVQARRDESEELVGQILLKRFEILSLIGQGGMGAVYRARQLSMQRDVAIKVLKQAIGQDPVAIKRFFKEAQAASQLNHPHTITVFDFGQTETGLLFIVMELLEGRSLAKAIRQDGPFPPSRAVGVLSQVCDALAEAHKQGIIHRDLKPDNIFLQDQEGSPDFVKVLDFGIAKVPSREGESTLTAAGQIVGTPAYMSPEHAMGQALLPGSDLYSLGVILYEMLAGVAPFRASSPMGLMLAHLNEPVPSVRAKEGLEVPEALDRMLQRTMAKRPDQRPATAVQFKQEMQAALQSSLIDLTAVPLRPLDGYRLPATPPPLSPPPPEPAAPRPSLVEGPTADQEADSSTLALAPQGELDATGEEVDLPPRLSAPPLARPVRPILESPPLPLPTGAAASATDFMAMPPSTRRPWLLPTALGVLFAGLLLGGVLLYRTTGLNAEQEIVVVEAAAQATAPVPVADSPPVAAGLAAAGPFPAADSAGPAAQPALPAQVRLSVRSRPTGARVSHDGRLLGTTPFEWEEAPRGQPIRLLFQRTGLVDQEVAVTPGEQALVEARLARSTPPPPAARPKPKPKPEPRPTPPPQPGGLTGWEE
ncbi:MAG: serine/threonine-protein kinase [Myxococcota bacterium]|nr:serine/threonine-protein kinase [Myxococcota bacterium]